MLTLSVALVMFAPALLGAKGEGCGGTAFSMTPAPDMEGQWDVTYDDVLGIEIGLGGAIYTAEIEPTGGAFTIDHEGQPITFDLDCARPAVVCPSEAFPSVVAIEAQNPEYPHRMYMQLPRQSCSGMTVAADPAECGAGTLNEGCDDVCMGDIVADPSRHFGVINEAGDHVDVLLGAAVATNGINCALLGISTANADMVNTGVAMEEGWESTHMENGQVVVGYAGGCLWGGDVLDDGTIETLVTAATVRFTTGFTAAKRP
ncbi:MAG: hypothetical protein JRH11_05395 [Deltaproteobacteria bacterium]|nr:hypothetical protein [Deltaproteobacteria bacterium]